MERTFECPYCHKRQVCLGVEVVHKCPSFKSQVVRWEEVTDDDR